MEEDDLRLRLRLRLRLLDVGVLCVVFGLGDVVMR